MRDIWTDNGRDPERIREICELLKDVWEKVPDLRFGQFLLNYIFDNCRIEDSLPSLKDTFQGMYPDRTNSLMFGQEDDVTFEILERNKESPNTEHKKDVKEME